MLKIKELRIKAGLSQKEVAKLLEINQGSYSQIENEKYMINAVMLSKLAIIFGCTTDDLIDFEEVKRIYKLNQETYEKIMNKE